MKFSLALISALQVLTELAFGYVDQPGHFDYMGGVTNASITRDPWIEIGFIFTPEKFYSSDTRVEPYPVKIQVPKVYFNSSFAEIRIMPCAADWGNQNANYTCQCHLLDTGPSLLIELKKKSSRSPRDIPFGPPSNPFKPPYCFLRSGNFTQKEHANGTLERTAFRSGGLFSDIPDEKISNIQVNITAWNGSQAIMEAPQRSPYPAITGNDLWITEKATWSTAATREQDPGVSNEIELQVPFFDFHPKTVAYTIPCGIIGDRAKVPALYDCQCDLVGENGLRCGMNVGPALRGDVVYTVDPKNPAVAVRLQWDGVLPSLSERGVSGVIKPNLTASSIRAAPFFEAVDDLRFEAIDAK
ncbi:MAG: hypothetical protein Q9169_007926 [Polycauliona sp. 2 TL-2023]